MANMLLRFLLDCDELKFLRRKYQPIRVSALGHKQTVMSALPAKADIGCRSMSSGPTYFARLLIEREIAR
jgi:hypothetical protein